MLVSWRRYHSVIGGALVVAATMGTPYARAQSRPQLAASTPEADSVAVAAALHQFLVAFDNLDWPAFRAAFSDSATVFHPAPEMAERVTGPRGIDSTFRAVFADIRAHARGGPPYQRLEAVDLRIQPLAIGTVLVTFELRNAERLGRRTFVFRKEGSTWRIFHLHASNIPQPSNARGAARFDSVRVKPNDR
jgi:ketosteroid isomerase-like protein